MNPARGARRRGPRRSGATSLRATLRARIETLLPERPRRLCVALSGGLDSTVLLAALCELRAPLDLRLRAVHVDHGLQAASREWARAARARARDLGVSCVVRRADIQPLRGASLEATARAARYRLLFAALRPGEWLVTAHHLDDQAETVLLQLLRGAGISGRAAMGEGGTRAGPRLLRPLLGISRTRLEAEARRRGLEWSEDPSNADPRFDRNFLRLSVLPLLGRRWPAVATTLARGAELAAEAAEAIAAVAAGDLARSRDGSELRASALRALVPARRRELLRLWLQGQGAPLPDQRRLKELATTLLDARHDSQPEVAWGEVAVRRYDDRLFLLPRDSLPVPEAISDWRWRRRPRLSIPGAGTLFLGREAQGDLDLRALPESLQLRFRRGGERLAEAGGQIELGQWLQQQRVPPWLRDRLPLLQAGTTVLAVADLWLHPSLRWRESGAPPAARGRLRFAPSASAGAGRADPVLLRCPPVVV